MALTPTKIEEVRTQLAKRRELLNGRLSFIIF